MASRESREDTEGEEGTERVGRSSRMARTREEAGEEAEVAVGRRHSRTARLRRTRKAEWFDMVEEGDSEGGTDMKGLYGMRSQNTAYVDRTYCAIVNGVCVQSTGVGVRPYMRGGGL